MLGEPPGDQPQPEILGDVGVLILVDQRVAKALLIVGEHVRVLQEQPQDFQQQVAEIGSVQFLEALLVGGIESRSLAFGKGESFSTGDFVRRQAAILPAVDEGGKLARGPPVLVQPFALDDLLDQPVLIVRVEYGEAGLQPHELGMPAQNFHADGMKRAEPGHALDGAPDEVADALLHLARRLVGEGDGENLRAARTAGAHDVGNARREDARLACTCARQYEHGAVERFHRGPLLGIEIGQIGGCLQAEGA